MVNRTPPPSNNSPKGLPAPDQGPQVAKNKLQGRAVKANTCENYGAEFYSSSMSNGGKIDFNAKRLPADPKVTTLAQSLIQPKRRS